MPGTAKQPTPESSLDNPMSLEQWMPAIYRQLVEAGDIAERYWQDVCDLEFTIQDGQLFIVGVRRARRSPIANLRFALQFLAEGKIDPREVLRRVTPADVAARAAPVIRNREALRPIGKGLAASSGIATGRIAFRASDVLDCSAKQIPMILAKREVSPEDLQAIELAKGVLTTRGGISSHAALICRQLAKPCVTAYSPMRGDVENDRDVRSLFREGSWITIDGTSGEIFEGAAKFEAMNWREHPELVALSEIVARATATGNVPRDATGHVWRISDFFLHLVPLKRGSTAKKSVSRSSFTSFTPPSSKTLAKVRSSLTPLAPKESANYGEILLSLMDVHSRLLSSAVGLAKHPSYFRPLWDPKTCVERTIEEDGTQLVGMEFFGINQWIPHLVDVATVTLFLKLDVWSESSEWFLDFTNPQGESLVAGSESVRAYRLLINDAEVQHDDLPVLYDYLRRREYKWQFYEKNLTSHAQIIDFLTAWASEKSIRSPLLPLCYELGLIQNRKLTKTGESLLGKQRRNQKYEFTTTNAAS